MVSFLNLKQHIVDMVDPKDQAYGDSVNLSPSTIILLTVEILKTLKAKGQKRLN